MAHVRRSPRIEANTGKKQVHFQNPRPVIKRAQNHVVPRHVSLSPPPQDSPAASPPLSTTGDTTPRRSVQLDKDPPVTTSRSSRIRRLPAGGEVQLDPDNPHLPRTFPIQDVGKPTPGTTFLNEPPEELLPPPPPRPTCETRPSSVPGPSRQRRLSSPANSDTSHESLPPQVTAYHQVNTLCRDIDIIRNQAIAVQRNLFQVMKDESRPRPLPVMVIHHENLLQDQVERYHEAQVLSGKKYSMATLITGQSQLIIEGRIPRVAVIDTGASSVIVGRAFGLHMDECQPENLIFGDTFVTAGGTKEKGLGRTINHLKFVLAKGTQAETTITAPVIIADTDAYDVILGMDFLGACFGYVDPLTEEFVWRVDCHKTETMPTIVARLPAKCRSKVQRETRHSYMLSLIDDPKDLQESILGEETKEEDFKEVHNMEIDAETVPAPMHVNTSTCAVRMTSHSPLTSLSAVHRRHEASARLDAIKRMNNPSIPPRTKWIGGSNHGALPINTTTQTFEKIAKTKGLHVLDLFAGISCGGLRTVLEAGYLVSCYTSVEIDDISRIIARKTLSDLQEQYPGQLPDKAIRGYNKRIPQNIQLISDNDLCNLVQQNGTINFVCGGWECQPMSMAGKHLGMDDDRFMPFLDMVRIINFLQANQIHPPLYLFENTYPGTPGQYPLIDDTAKMVESFLGAPIVLDAAGMGSAAHRVRLFWTNWEQSNILQKAIPQDKYPEPSLESILHHDHVSTVPVHTPVHPFVKHNKQGRTRKCMPTIVSYPKSHAYRTKENGKPGEGQLWNKTMKRWDEPSLNEKEQMMGYNIDATKAGHVTIGQRAMRLGQAMDGNTMRWLGAFLYATQRETTFTKTPPFDKPKSKVRLKSILKTSLRPVDNIEDHHHQACAIVEQITTMENFHLDSSLGGSVSQNKRPKIDIDNTSDVDKKKISDQDTKKQSWETEKPRWKIGPNLKERDQLQVLKVLTDNNDRFAYKIEELERYTGPPMEIKLNSHEDIFRPPHKLGEKEWTFVGEQCAKLEKMGFIRKSHQSNYASATVVVRKKDENGEYTDLRKCGDYRPLNLETDLDRYQLPLIESIFNDMKGAQIFSKLDLRSGYHQMALLEADRAKTAFWGAQRILWEWCVVPFGLKNAPSYFQKQMDKVLLNLSFARCYIDDIIIWSKTISEHFSHLTEVFDRLRKAGLKVHPGKCMFAVDKIDFLGHCISAEGLSPQDEKVAAVRELPPPKDISSLRSALGLFSYYRKFVKGFSVIASPLHQLLRKGALWHWGKDQQTSFLELKEKLCTTEVLRRPDSTLPYVLATDWSQKGMGAVLSQIDKEGKEHPVSYASKSCNPAEKNYGSCEGECLAVVWATDHFREYLFGTPFTLITDHEPLKWLMQTNKTTGKLARWSLLLQEYDMKVVHKRGSLNTNADCLSRYPTQVDKEGKILPDWNKGDYNLSPATVFAFMATQLPEDEHALQTDIWHDEPVLHFLKTHEYSKGLNAHDKDRVYRRAKNFRWLAHNLYKTCKENTSMLLIPPPDEREELTKKIHRDMGHFGIHRMIDRLQRNYWWKGMDDTVKKVIRACVPCARTKAGFRISGTELQPLKLQGIMFRWGIDFAGPLPESDRGNKYVLVCIEHCTKWVELIPLPSKSSSHVATAFLENILARYGVPGEVITDQGTEFQGQFQDLLSKQEITHRVASRDNPQADGLAERMVQTLKQSLRRCLLDQSWGIPWDEILPYVAMGYRVSKQKSTGYSPYFLLYGRQPLFPTSCQQVDDTMLEDNPTRKRKFQDDLTNRANTLREVMPLAMRNLAIAQQRDRERYRHVRGGKYDRPKAKFAIGEMVMLRQKKYHTLQPTVRPHILRIKELRPSGVVVLQGSDGTTINHQISQIAKCSVPISDATIYPETFTRTNTVHCQTCGSRRNASKMLLCDECNKGFHTFCLTQPLEEVPLGIWKCETHKVTL